jgi:WD40 repeat protein
MTARTLFIAQPNYAAKDSWVALPDCAKAAKTLAEGLASHGFDLSHPELLDGGKKQAVESILNNWFARIEEGAFVFLYWTGHGISDGATHYLICRNSPATKLSGLNSIDTRIIGTVLANCEAEKILVILDCCHAGQGADEIAEGLRKILATRKDVVGRQRAFAIIAAAHPLEQAEEAVFSNALYAALFKAEVPPEDREWSDNDQFIHTSYLCNAAIKLMPPDASQPQYLAKGSAQKFFPNPLWRGGLQDRNVEEHQRFLCRMDGAEHFEASARGIESGAQGWFFSGRKRLLQDLIAWFGSKAAGVRIVTGLPGTGKSAVLGRLATLSDPQLRQSAIVAGAIADEDPIPREGAFDAVVHVKGKTTDDCARIIAKDLGVTLGDGVSVDVERLVAEVGKLSRDVTLMFDALDEAADGQGRRIATQLIAPLGHLAGVKVLVGSRRSLDGAPVPEDEERHQRLREAFAMARIDDLSDEPDTNEDIAAYVRKRLQTSARHWSHDPQIVEQAARRVAEHADGVFLYARIVSRTLEDREDLEGLLPQSALAAYEQDLATRFKGDEQRVDDLLGALAWGQGKGLTRDVWAPVANAVAQRERQYGKEDVAWALGRAGWHITEAGEDGQAVYRLSHQALADRYLERAADKAVVEGRIVEALRRDLSGTDWLDCDKYLWRYLSTHATKAGKLDELIRDPCYLAVAEPARLLAALGSITNEESLRHVRIYERVVDRLVEERPIDRLPLVHMIAQFEDPELAPRLEPPIPTRWLCRWARVRPSVPHRVIGREASSIDCITLGQIKGEPVVVTGNSDGSVGLWDLRKGKSIRRSLEPHKARVTCVALGEIDDAPVIVSGSDDDTIRLWDARSGALIGRPIACPYAIHGVSLSTADGLVSCIGGNDIRIWDARSRVPVERAPKGYGQVCSFGTLDGTPIIISKLGRAVHVWDAQSGRLMAEPIRLHKDGLDSIAVGMTAGTPVIAAWESRGFSVHLWSLRSGDRIAGPLKDRSEWVTSVAVGTMNDAPVVVTGRSDGTIRLWDALSGKPRGRTLEGHADKVRAVIAATVDGEAIIVSAGNDGTIRLWHEFPGEMLGQSPELHTGVVTSVAMDFVDDKLVVVSASHDETVRRWDARSGERIGSPLRGHSHWVTSVALGTIDDDPVIISGSEDDTIRRWDARGGTPIGRPLEGHMSPVWSIELGKIHLAPVIISGSFDDTLRRWDARNGAPVGRPLKGHSEPVTCVRLGVLDGKPVIVSGSVDQSVRLWDARSGLPISEPFKGHTEEVTSVAMGRIDGEPVIVSGSNDKTVRLWGARSGLLKAPPFKGHIFGITSIALGFIGNTAVVISASKDHTVRIWDARTGNTTVLCTLGSPVNSIALAHEGQIALALARGVALLKISSNVMGIAETR